ncbi:MAG: imidazolonepropionase [Rhizomicrobium sp.]
MTAAHTTDQIWYNARLWGAAHTAPDTDTVRANGLVAVTGGRIVYAGPAEDAPALDTVQRTDCAGRLITPALIDCHSHILYGGNRAGEFSIRQAGGTYIDIARAGGGIAATVAATSALDEDALLATSLKRIDALLAEGVGTLEIKSGYGLSLEAELRMLRAARRLERVRPVRVRTSYLAAHAIPAAYRDRREAYMNDVVLPGLVQAHEQGLADAVDAFCETIAFTPDEIRRLFNLAHNLGLPVKLHAEQMTQGAGAQLAAQYHALSADHLEWLSADDADALAKAGTVAVLLPGAFYALRETQKPPVASLRTAGARIAIATDCNPGTSPLCSLLLAMNLAATLFDLTANECLQAVTSHAAMALGITQETGSLTVGTSADLAIWDAATAEELVYGMGFNPLWRRIHRGQTIERSNT